jgi:hypothetical protein
LKSSISPCGIANGGENPVQVWLESPAGKSGWKVQRPITIGIVPQRSANAGAATPERFPAKACPGLDPVWVPVRLKKTRQNEMTASVPIASERKRLLRQQATGLLYKLK